MNSKKRNYKIYLDDIFESMKRIEGYIKDIDFQGFQNNQMVIDATVRNFEIIGEASKNIPKDVQNKYVEVPWRKMYGLRNLISHEYFGIDLEMLWEIAIHNLPENQIEIERIIKAEKELL